MEDDAPDLNVNRRRGSLLIVGAFIVMVVYLLVSYAHPAAAVIGCPFHALTGYSCFGCGMTRSTAHFLHGHFVEALHFHPFGPVFIVAFAAAAAHHAVQLVHGAPLEYRALKLWRRFERPIWVAAALFLGVFGVIRFVGELTGFLTPI